MIGLTKLLFESENFGDSLRYAQGSKGVRHGAAQGMGPVVVWNCTGTCNLECIHCYYDAAKKRFAGELTTDEAEAFIDDLAECKAPVLLFSGGEPLVREDVFHLMQYAARCGVRPTLSTNGVLIDREVARDLQKIGVGYVGISLDGMEDDHDRFRGKKGAFRDALEGIQHCRRIDQRVGLRFTITKHNYADLADILRLIEEEGIPRVCFYHLVYSGRGKAIVEADVSKEETRSAMDLILAKTLDWERRGVKVEVLMVDNHADGIYAYLWAKKHLPERAPRVLELLRLNGGNRAGIAFGNVDSQGDVHPDQFTRNHTFGNIRKDPFSRIWLEAKDPILAGLKDRKPLLQGRCASCAWLDVCNGNFRARAEAVSGDFWGEDPACYLTDAEIRERVLD